MNERIDKLLTKMGHGNDFCIEDLDLEKFVELIVKESADQCMQEHWAIVGNDLEPGSTEFERGARHGRKMMASTLATKIKKHFGVE